jgi:hypothetical protein
LLRIAHRGNTNGSDIYRENTVAQILNAISAGFDVEVDVWYVNGDVFLGHDGPEYLVPKIFLVEICHSAWYHCKNLEALEFFATELPGMRHFWHEEDRFTLTSDNYIWTYPGQPVTPRSIIVDLDLSSWDSYKDVAYAVCTDYPTKMVN